MMSYILILLLLALALLTLAIATRPAAFSVTRSASIAAPVEAVFRNVNDLAAWEHWSPWAKLDPNAKSTFSGPVAGPGAAMAWEGNMQVGAGQMTIVDSKPNEQVVLRLDFKKPMKATNQAVFTFQPDGAATRVTWTMSGQNNFAAKAMNCVVDCDKMVGGMFEQGLANLKAVAERQG